MNESLDKLVEAWQSYNEWLGGSGQTFGQYFMKKHLTEGFNSQIFFETNKHKAYDMLYHEIVGGNIQTK